MNPSEWKNASPGHYERDYGQGYTGTLKMIPSAPLGQQWQWSVRHGLSEMDHGLRGNGRDAGEAADEAVSRLRSPAGYAALPGIAAGYTLAERRSHARYCDDLTAIHAAMNGDEDEDGGALTLADMAAKIACAMHGERVDMARQAFDTAVRCALSQALEAGEDQS